MSTFSHKPDISIVGTLYKSAQYLSEFAARIKSVTSKLNLNYELIFIDDGSPDNSAIIVKELIQEDNSIVLVELSRNYGHHKAIMTGLEHARADLVFLIDVDLEEEPESLSEFISELNRTGADVIYGVQISRKGGYFEKLSGSIFYWIFNKLSFYPIPYNFVTARLMNKNYIAALLQHREQELFLGGLWAITGFDQRPLGIVKKSSSESTYNIARKISLLVNSITSFSNTPLVCVFYLGTFITLLSIIGIIYVVILRLLYADIAIGWPSLILSIWFLCGLIIFCLGILGIYLAKIFIETKNRPYTIVKKVTRGNRK